MFAVVAFQELVPYEGQHMRLKLGRGLLTAILRQSVTAAVSSTDIANASMSLYTSTHGRFCQNLWMTKHTGGMTKTMMMTAADGTV